jgi:hypothetical protein
MLNPKFCYLLSQVKTKPYVEPQQVVQIACTKPEDEEPCTMQEIFNTFSINDYISNK